MAKAQLEKRTDFQVDGLPIRRRMDQHDNNFNAIRLLLACLVLVSHSFPLSLAGGNQYEPLMLLTRQSESLGTAAVGMFFFISGMLITASWFRSGSMQNFVYRRILRIYPGFIAALLFTAILTWAGCPTFRVWVDQNPINWLALLVRDVIHLSNLSAYGPYVYPHDPLPQAANGSLWTIPGEFECYLMVAFLGTFGFLKRRTLLLTCTVALWLSYLVRLLHGGEWNTSVARLVLYFMVGVLAWVYRDKIPLRRSAAIILALLLLVTVRVAPCFQALWPVAGSYIVLYVGLHSPWRLTRWTEKTDLSYGVYLYAFPVQQFLATFPSLRNPFAMTLVALPTVLALAGLSWRFLESPCLKLKSRMPRDFDPGVGNPAMQSIEYEPLASAVSSRIENAAAGRGERSRQSDPLGHSGLKES